MPIIIYKHPEHSATNAIRAFNATVRALAADDEVVEFNSRELQFRFAQDQCLVLDKEKVVIFPNSPGIPDDLKNEIVSHFEAQGFEVLETETFFEGGNIVRVNDTIFHGNYPAGGYLSTGHGRDQVKKYNEVVAEMQEMARAHPKLSHLTFDELGLATQFNEGIEFAQRFPIFNGNFQLYIPEEEFDETLQSSAMKNFTAWREYFYHLDCFIALAPDNKIFILSSNILSSESIAKLRVAADNNIQLVDLGHDNFIDEPTMLN